MNTTVQTVLGIIVVIVLLYVAFVVGAAIIRIMVGLFALLVAGLLVRSLVLRMKQPRRH
jgi:uncharacterized membrane protein YraQ (UPF0718 family)